MSSHVILRCTLVVLALFVVVGLALSLRATRLEADGREVVERAEQGEISQAEVRAGLDTLRRARRFSADSEPMLVEVSLLANTGRGEQAMALAERVVESEPENLEGWLVLYVDAAFRDNRPRAARAMRALEALNPQLADDLRARAPQGP